MDKRRERKGRRRKMGRQRKRRYFSIVSSFFTVYTTLFLGYLNMQEPRNTSVVFCGCCLMTCTGAVYKLAVTVHRCLRYRAPRYLADCCVFQSPKLPAANISVRPAFANWIFRGFVAAHLARASFLSRRSDGLKLTAWFVAWSGRRVWTF